MSNAGTNSASSKECLKWMLEKKVQAINAERVSFIEAHKISTAENSVKLTSRSQPMAVVVRSSGGHQRPLHGPLTLRLILRHQKIRRPQLPYATRPVLNLNRLPLRPLLILAATQRVQVAPGNQERNWFFQQLHSLIPTSKVTTGFTWQASGQQA